MAKITAEQAIQYLHEAKIQMDTITTWEMARLQLQMAGREVGYKPAFRCLVMGITPENSVRWEEN